MTGWEALGGNPVPGDPAEVEALADRLAAASDEAARLRQDLEDVGFRMTDAGVQGPVLDGFVQAFGELPGTLVSAADAFAQAAALLLAHADEMAAFRARAADLRDAAAAAAADVARLADAVERDDAEPGDVARHGRAADVLASARADRVRLADEVEVTAVASARRLSQLLAPAVPLPRLADALDQAHLPGVGSVSDLVGEGAAEVTRAAVDLRTVLDRFAAVVGVGGGDDP